MKPLFPFYGSKWRDARRYAAPRARVVEPFAGSAGYSTYWEPADVLLTDADPIVVSVWEYLIRTPAAEILALPDLDIGQSVDDLTLPQEARWFIGFWLNRGSSQPKKTQTAYSKRTERQQLTWSKRARERVARDIEGVRHWQVRHAAYWEAPDRVATWFVDPPYTVKGRYYRFHDIDYSDLATWCQTRRGTTIVCEQAGADWLPFQPLASIKSSRGRSNEVVWRFDA